MLGRQRSQTMDSCTVWIRHSSKRTGPPSQMTNCGWSFVTSIDTNEWVRVEHEFSNYLRARGQALPLALQCANGDTVVQDGDFMYEVHERTTGVDLYRDVPSWHPFAGLDHARRPLVDLVHEVTVLHHRVT